MDSKEVKAEILAHRYNERKLDSYIEADFKSSIQGMFNALFVLLRDVNKNERKIDDLLAKMNELVNKIDDKERLMLISKKIEDVVVRTNKHMSKNNLKAALGILTELREMAVSANNKIKMKNMDATLLLLRRLVYDDKDLTKIKAIFDKQADLLKVRSRKALFTELLGKCIRLEENSEEANYYFKVISIILASRNRYHILNDANIYLQMLNKAKPTATIKSIRAKFEKNYCVSEKELEKRYDISFRFYPPTMNGDNYKKLKVEHQDLIKYPSIAIDDEGNACNDDAICMYPNGDGTYTLRIDITSVPAIVPFMSYFDREAYKRVETIYSSTQDILMYPPHISYKQGSLLENSIRYVLSYMYRVDSNFNIIEGSFKINCAKTSISNNLSHTQAKVLLNTHRTDELSKMLHNLSYVASKLDNPTGTPTIISSDKMVSKLMGLANKNVGSYFKSTGYPFIYRVYQKQDNQKRKELLQDLGISKVKGQTCQELIKIIALETAKAHYSDKPDVHEALGYEAYANVTKPLRSYPSALSEYIIYDIIINGHDDNATLYKWEEILKEAMPHINERIRLNTLFLKEYETLQAKGKIRRKQM